MAHIQIGTMQCPVGTILTVAGPDMAMTVTAKNEIARCAKINCLVMTDDTRPGMYLVECPDHGTVEATPKYWQSEVSP